MNDITSSNNNAQIELEIKRFLTVPLRLKILQECLLLLFFKMANDTADILVEKSTVHSSDRTNKTVYALTVYE